MGKKSVLFLVICSVVLSMLTAYGEFPELASASDQPALFGVNDSAPADYQWNSSEATYIALDGDSITVDGAGAVVNGSQVTIVAAGAYSISGYLADGQIIVDTDDAESVGLILNGVNISSSTGAPIYVANAAEAIIVIADGTENYVSDGPAYVFATAEEDEPNAAIFSSDDLTIEGNGTLTVIGNYNDGIASKDGLIITGGTIVVNAVDDGIRGKDHLVVYDGQITVDAQGDGLKSDNAEDAGEGYIAIEAGTIYVSAGGDAIQAQTSVTIAGGEFSLVSGGGSNNWIDETTSAKGIKATLSVTIDGGMFTIDSADDAIHSNDSIVINGGTLNLASGDDGIHADAALTVNGGYVNIIQSFEAIESAVITINNGTVYLTASDDGFNAAGDTGGGGAVGNYYLYINGGYIVANAGGDGLDSNGYAEMTDGVVIVNGPVDNKNGAIDVNGSFNITGGFMVAAGSSGMAEAPSETSTQYSMQLNFDSVMQSGTLVHIESSDGNEIITFAAAKQFQSIVVSSPEFSAGATYNVYYGGSASGTVSDGLYQDASYSGGTQYTSFTISNVVTSLGATSNVGGPGSRGGRN